MTKATIHTCDHCGLRFSGPAVTDGDGDGEAQSVFCCAGCQAVYHTLHGAGLDEFYSHRQSWTADEARPVDEESLQSDTVDLFDSQTFLEDHTELLDDGTRRTALYLEGVHCAGCIWLVERMPRLVEGVVDARLELSRGRMTVRWNPDQVALSDVARWLGRFGFQAHPLHSTGGEERSDADKKMLIRVGICWAIAANVMLLTIAKYAGLDAATDPGLHAAVLWTTLGLSAVSLVAGGVVFFRRALASFRTRRLSMDVPIAAGIAVGWGHSAWGTFTGSGEVWFDSIVILIAALLTARYLQIRGNKLAADAASRLVSLLPNTARRLVPDPTTGEDSVQVVAAESVEVGDRLHVRAGDAVPADGYVVDGHTDLSRAVLTGESRPEKAEPGDRVEAGTTNLTSPITLCVTATGEDTRVGQLMAWVESGSERRAPVVQLADRLSSVFITVVLAAAIATAIAWSFIDPSRAVANVVALLVIACPCALGMATPLALTVGSGQAARRGIHIKHSDVIEALEGVTDIIFDKTGTLTEGRPRVVDIWGDTEALRRACALETRSRHPVAEALLRWERGQGQSLDSMSVDDVEELPGTGIRGLVDGQQITVGRLSFFNDIDGEALHWTQEQLDRGHSPIGVAVDGQLRAIATVGDELREEAVEVIDGFRRRGMRVHLLSGDHPRVVDAAGRALSIPDERIYGGATPEDKLEYIDALSDETTRIVMVGDGVNDAAALRRADIGVAVHGGTEASLVAADAFVVKNGVQPVAELFEGSRRVMHVVRRNLAGSGTYNLFGITLAAMGFITPLAAAVLMPISSLAVVASSVLQRSFSTNKGPRKSGSRTAQKSTTKPLPTPFPVGGEGAGGAVEPEGDGGVDLAINLNAQPQVSSDGSPTAFAAISPPTGRPHNVSTD